MSAYDSAGGRAQQRVVGRLEEHMTVVGGRTRQVILGTAAPVVRGGRRNRRIGATGRTDLVGLFGRDRGRRLRGNAHLSQAGGEDWFFVKGRAGTRWGNRFDPPTGSGTREDREAAVGHRL